MKKAACLTALTILALAAPHAGRSESATPAQPTAPAATPDLETDRAAIGASDPGRMLTDQVYAAEILARLDRLAAAAVDDPEYSSAIDHLRLFALMGLQRADEIRATVDRMLAARPRDPDRFGASWMAALSIDDIDRALTVVETASRNVPGSGWAQLREFLERDMVGALLQRFHTEHQEAKRVRLAQALFRIGWPGGDDKETADFLRTILMEDRLRERDNAGAAGFAAGITTPAHLLPMLVQTRYDSVLAPGRDRLEMLRQSLADRDRDTADALVGSPQDQRRVLDRAQYLRALGRNEDALALLQPFTRDVPATVAGGEFGMWLVNEAAYALLALGRGDEAVALMQRLVALPLAANPGLIGPVINHAEILTQAGRHAEALDHARGVEASSAQYANDYGKAWVSAAIVCALAGLDRNAEAAPPLERLLGQSEVNPAALTRAYLCVGDTDRAAALIVHRLQSDEPDSAILALQDYSLSRGNAQQGPLFDRLLALRDRPEVRAALGRVGRVLTLPLARTYWGEF